MSGENKTKDAIGGEDYWIVQKDRHLRACPSAAGGSGRGVTAARDWHPGKSRRRARRSHHSGSRTLAELQAVPALTSARSRGWPGRGT